MDCIRLLNRLSDPQIQLAWSVDYGKYYLYGTRTCHASDKRPICLGGPAKLGPKENKNQFEKQTERGVYSVGGNSLGKLVGGLGAGDKREWFGDVCD